MAMKCNKCGLEVAFSTNANGKRYPTNLDGSDHWGACRSARLANVTPEERAASAASDAQRNPPKMILARDGSHFWSDLVPPWDESLGSFREFTPAEIAIAIVCKPRDSE